VSKPPQPGPKRVPESDSGDDGTRAIPHDRRVEREESRDDYQREQADSEREDHPEVHPDEDRGERRSRDAGEHEEKRGGQNQRDPQGVEKLQERVVLRDDVAQQNRELVGGEDVDDGLSVHPRLAPRLVDGVRRVHEDDLNEQRDRRDGERGRALAVGPGSADRPSVVQREEDSPEEEHPQQGVTAVDDHRVPEVERPEQEPRGDRRNSRPVPDGHREGERASDDEQQALYPRFAPDRVERVDGSVRREEGFSGKHAVVGVERDEVARPEREVREH